MSAISLKSITGITSITTPTGVDNQLTLHNNNTTEAVKLDTAGNLHFHNHLNITGVSTASNFKTGTSNLHNTGLNVQDLDVDGHTNLDNVSVAGVSTFTGAITAHDYRSGGGVGNTLYLTSADDWRFRTTGGSEKLRITSAGKVGINQSSSIQTRLHVSENLAESTAINWANSTMSLSSVVGGNSTNNRSTLYFAPYNSSNQYCPSAISCTAGTNYQSTLKFFTNGNGNGTGHLGAYERLRIDTSGRVGIATDNPKRILHVNDTIGGGIAVVGATSGIQFGLVDMAGASYNAILSRAGTNDNHITGSTPRDLCLAPEREGAFILGLSPHLGAMTTGVHISRLRHFNIYYGGDFKINTGSPASPSEKVRITSAGQVQINTDGGSGALTLGASQDFKLYHDAGGPTIFSDTGNQGFKLQIKELNLTEYSGTTTRLKIDTTGRVLIGVDTATNNDSYVQAFKPSGNDATITVGNVATSASGLCRYDFAPSNKVVGSRIECHASEDFSTNANRTADLVFITRKDGTLSEKLRITAGGNIGINETSPQQQLHVHDDTNYHGILINGNSAPRIAFARSTTTTGEWSVGIDGTNGNNFVINRSNDNSNRYFVISNGQTNSNQNTVVNGVLFNNDIRSTTATNDDSTSNVKISARNAAAGHGNYCIIGVSGNTYFGAGANSYSSNPSGNNITGGTTIRVYGGISSNAYNDAHRFGRNTDGSIVIFQSAGGTEGSIAISGSTTNYNTSSDYRLKENIVNITDGITRLKQLKPRRFNFIKDPSITKDGFIAHEVDSIVPEAVTGTKDETFSKDDEDNNVKAGDPKYQHMDASKLIPLLTSALQEAVAKIETLETKVAALESS